MIPIYIDSTGGRVKVIFRLDDDNNILSVKVGNSVVHTGSGYQFYVDKHVAKQIDKVDIDFSDGKPELIAKEGEEIQVPEMTDEDKDLEIERLKKRLDDLQGE